MQAGSEYLQKQLQDLRDALYNDELPLSSIIDELENTLIKKGQDYSGDKNQWHNFDFAREMSQVSSLEQVIVVLCSIKFSRLNSLVFSNREKPNFESIDDNLKDLVNYLILLIGYLEYSKNGKV